MQRTDGVAYLEKIVQVPFRLPDPAPAQLSAIVVEGVDVLAAQQRIPEEERDLARDKLRFLSLLGLGGLWDNMRKANRFLDSLRLTLPSVSGEVRLHDFVLLEALRLTQPRVYERTLGVQNLLLGASPGAEALLMSPGSSDPQEEANRATSAAAAAIGGAVDRAEVQSIVAEILEELFPRVSVAERRSGSYGPEFVDE